MWHREKSVTGIMMQEKAIKLREIKIAEIPKILPILQPQIKNKFKTADNHDLR